jgi:hypothetical protein
VIAAWPSGYDVERYAEEHGLDFEDITRDIVRIATVAHLVGAGVLDEDFVLTGGMALRLRGSSRFTIKDTDSSLRGRLDELELSRRLRLDDDHLQVYPDPGTNRGRKTPNLLDVKPIKYEAYFASVTGDPIEGQFSFTVSQRGLFEPAVWLALRHPYPQLVVDRDDLSVPVMRIAEQAAEKVVGWAAGSLVKHYLDLAWIGREFGETLIAADLQRLVQRKLDVGTEIFPGAYKDLHEINDLLIPLSRPREWQGPLNKAGDNGASLVRFMGPKMGFDEAIHLVRKHIIPKLFTMNA